MFIPVPPADLTSLCDSCRIAGIRAVDDVFTIQGCGRGNTSDILRRLHNDLTRVRSILENDKGSERVTFAALVNMDLINSGFDGC